MKIFLILLCLILALLTVIVIFLESYWFNDKDYCLDTGRCTEGLEINTEHGRIIINKENCLKYKWKWDEKRRDCNIRH
ncbi:MAG: hypothetical protein A2Y25_12065 [Candidatus Melainabacteria bacterium GWF2_37_15]|nr:MAG: hypothetical protein A2Y25_12065 [Candidatus Melainabacteria bacterium GWF2_37_15]